MELANPETETMLLSAFLRDPVEVGRKCVEAALVQEAFSIPENAAMYAFLLGHHCEGNPMQRYAIARSLKAVGLLESVGGSDRIQALFVTEAPASAAGMLIDELKELARRRDLVIAADTASREIQENAPVLEVEERLRRILDSATIPSALEIKTPAEMNHELLDRAMRNDTIATGFDSIDGRSTMSVGPLCRGDLLVVSGQRKAGKSVLAANIASYVARNHPVVIFTIEMSRLEVWKRVVASESGVSSRYWSSDYQAKEWELQNVTAAMKRLKDTRLIVVDRVIDIDQSIAVAKMLKMRYGDLGAAVWDYCQLFEAKGVERRSEAVAYVSMMTKRASTALNCLGIAVSQLNDDGRALESRGPERDCNAMLKVLQPNEESEERQVMCAYNRSGPMGFMLEVNAELNRCRFVNS